MNPKLARIQVDVAEMISPFAPIAEPAVIESIMKYPGLLTAKNRRRLSEDGASKQEDARGENEERGRILHENKATTL